MGHLLHLTLASTAALLAMADLPRCQSASPTSQPVVGREAISLARASSGLAVQDGQLIGAGGDYKVVFAEGGALFTPALGDGVPENQTLRLTFESARRGSRVVPTDAARADLSRIDDCIAQYRHGDLVERFDVRADALKQSFVFDRQPAGDGDLVVRLRLDTNMAATSGERLKRLGLRFDGQEAAHIGAVVGVDADGQRIPGHMDYDGEHLELVLPGWFVASARYPLTLDPPICCGTNLFGSNQQQHRPDVAYEPGSDRYLVAWERVFSANDQDIFAHFVSGSGNAQGGLLLIDNGTDRETKPTVCAVSASSKFVIAYEDLVNTGPGTFATTDINGRTVDATTGALGPMTLLVGLFDNAWNPCLGGDSSGIDNECVLVYEQDNGNAISSREITVTTSGALNEVASRRRTVGVATTTPGIQADPAISKDAGTAGLFAIAWVRDDQESSLGLRFMDRNSTMRSLVGVVNAGSRARNVHVAGDGERFVIAHESAEANGPKQDILAFDIFPPASATALPTSSVSGPLAGTPDEDETDPAIALAGNRMLLGSSVERSAPRGPYTLLGEFEATGLQRIGPSYGVGSVATFTYNLESAIAVRSPAPGQDLDGLHVFRVDVRPNGSLVSSDIRIWRTTTTFATASAEVVAGCPAGPHAFGGPRLQLNGNRPVVGTTMWITADLLAGTQLCALELGLPTAPVPLSLIGSNVPGSASCVNPIVTVVVPPIGGSSSATYGLVVPNNPSLSGAQLDVQWVDYEGTGMNFGTSSSARLTVGY